jgi:hypothetical protein
MLPSGAGPGGRQNLGLENYLGLARRAFQSANCTGFETSTLEAPDNDHNPRRIFTIDEDLLGKFDRILLTCTVRLRTVFRTSKETPP